MLQVCERKASADETAQFNRVRLDAEEEVSLMGGLAGFHRNGWMYRSVLTGGGGCGEEMCGSEAYLKHWFQIVRSAYAIPGRARCASARVRRLLGTKLAYSNGNVRGI